MRRTLITALLLAVVVGGCGDGAGSGSGGDADSGTLRVFAAASLSSSFAALDRAFGELHPGASIKLDLGHPPAQVQAIGQGAPADVLATAGGDPMQQAVGKGELTGAPAIFTRNRLEIVVAAGNPHHIAALGDLARSGLIVLLPDPSVPAGAFAHKLLARAGVEVHPRSLEQGVAPIVSKVGMGEADAGIVYATDVRAGGSRVQGVAIPARDNLVAAYPIGVVKGGHAALARSYVRFVRSPAGQAILERLGFLGV